ncbi:unnamed protein product [Ectocarpus sp. 4 AP-2014]
MNMMMPLVAATPTLRFEFFRLRSRSQKARSRQGDEGEPVNPYPNRNPKARIEYFIPFVCFNQFCFVDCLLGEEDRNTGTARTVAHFATCNLLFVNSPYALSSYHGLLALCWAHFHLLLSHHLL